MKHFTFNGCYRSDMTISPANWRTARASMRKAWRITYRFYDEKFKDDPDKWALQVSIRGMNDLHSLVQRQAVTESLLRKEKDRIDVQGYNPVTGLYMAPLQSTAKLCEDTPFIRALELGLKKVDADPGTVQDIGRVIRFFGQSASALYLDMVPIKDVRRGDIMNILDNCANLTKTVNGQEVPKIWNDNQYNYFRKYLSIVFVALETLQVVDYNPVHKIPVKQIVDDGEARQVLTDHQRDQVIEGLRRHPEFLRFIRIFYPSGTRIAEFCRVQGKHVDLTRQRFRVLIKKRKKKAWVWKTITDAALPAWTDLMADCGNEDYIFGLRLKPGPKPLSDPGLIGKRWKRLIKQKLSIDVDLYALHHLYASETIDEVVAEREALEAGIRAAAEQKGHTTGRVIEGTYDVRKGARAHEAAKKRGKAFD